MNLPRIIQSTETLPAIEIKTIIPKQKVQIKSIISLKYDDNLFRLHKCIRRIGEHKIFWAVECWLNNSLAQTIVYIIWSPKNRCARLWCIGSLIWLRQFFLDLQLWQIWFFSSEKTCFPSQVRNMFWVTILYMYGITGYANCLCLICISGCSAKWIIRIRRSYHILTVGSGTGFSARAEPYHAFPGGTCPFFLKISDPNQVFLDS